MKMVKRRAWIAPTAWKAARQLPWVLPWLCACSVYDTSLLGADASAGSDGSGLATNGGDATNGGEAGAETGGEGSALGGAGGGDPSETGGTLSGGSASGGAGNSSQGGALTTGGGSATGGTLGTGGASTGGAPATGGTLGTGGARTGGAPATGGTLATGGSVSNGKGGASTGGASTGGAPTGGTSTGGAGGCSGSDCCPSDPNKTAPGVCGCGIPDQDSGTSAGCVGLRTALVHRYTFAGSGSQVSDSIGTAHGTVVNTTLGNTGSLTLAGTTTDQYVDLPNGIVSSLTNASIEIWLTWSGGNVWQRILDFGDTGGVEGTQGSGTGTTYLFLTPKTGTTERCLRATFTANGIANETFVSAPAALATNTLSHISIVVDDSNDLFTLYLDGTVAGSVAFTGHLAALNDVNNWLARSQSSGDAEFGGVLHELRIYGAALSAQQIQLTERTGPDPTFL